MKELIIKPIDGFQNYFIDNFGQVYSNKNRGGHDGFESPVLRKRKPYIDKRNRASISISKNHKYFKFFISELVLTTFVSPRPDGMLACHGVLGSLVNTPENLYWATPTQNQLDRFRDGTDCSGAKNTKAKLTNDDVLNIRRLYTPRKVTRVFLANKYGVDRSTIDKILMRKYWKHI